MSGCAGSCLLGGLASCGGRGLPSSCAARAPHCGGFSGCGARLQGARASVAEAGGLSGHGSRALELGLRSRAQAWLFHSMWDLPRSGAEPRSPDWQAGS